MLTHLVLRQTRLADQTDEHPHGFSLIELLVVVAILAILAAVAIPTFLNQKKKASDGVVTSELKTLTSVLASSMVADNVVVSAGADGNPTSNSGNLTIDGTAVPKNGAIVFVNTGTNPKQWCVSRQSSSGRIYSASNTNRSVFESTDPCTSAGTTPNAGTNTSGTIVSATGNLLTANQATLADGNTAGWFECLQCTRTVASGIAGSAGTYVLAVTSSAGRTYDFVYPGTNQVSISGTSPITTSFRMRAATVGRTIRAYMVYWAADGSYIAEAIPNSGDSWVTDTTTGWTTATSTFTNIPANARKVTFRIFIQDASRPVGETHYFDNIGLWEGTGGVWALPGQPIYQ